MWNVYSNTLQYINITKYALLGEIEQNNMQNTNDCVKLV